MVDSIAQARALLKAVDELWQPHRASVVEAFTDATHGLEELVRADGYHQHSQDPDQLERSLGPLGQSNLDLGALSNMLGKSTHSRAMASDRFERVQSLIPELAQVQEHLSTTLAESASVDIERDSGEILSLAEDHLGRAARVFRTLRMAQMEVRSKYESETHDTFFRDFGWRQLAPNELRYCPPFVIVARLDEGSGATLRKIVSLLETGMPITILALRSSLRGHYPPVADTGVPAALSVEMVPVAMRGVHLTQTCACVEGFQDQFFASLVAPRPTVLSVLVGRHIEAAETFERRADGAIRSRAFPIFSYDPDRAERFGDCFDLSSNPAPHDVWTINTLRGPDPLGHMVELEEPFTFAHFAADEAEFDTEFSDPPEDADDLVPMIEYLDLTGHQRVGKRAFISRVGEGRRVVRKVVSDAVALQAAERRHLWRTLQDLAGLDDPHLEEARAALTREMNARQQASVQQLRTEMEAKMAEREKEAVAIAVRNLVTKLAGTTHASD